MTIVSTKGARSDLEDILRFTEQHCPDQLAQLERRINGVLARVERRPKSAPEVRERPGVRVALLIRYPFKIHYREIPGGIEILSIRHTARRTQ